MEALRGGPNPVLSNGQPGVTTNFILREGSEDTEGLVKFTTSDYDLRRFDGYLSGDYEAWRRADIEGFEAWRRENG